MAGARYTKVIKLVREAEDLARSGALVLDDGAAAIYFLWGQPSHAYMNLPDGERVEGEPALKQIALSLAHPGKVTWRSKDVIQTETLRGNAEDLLGVLQAMAKAGAIPAGTATPAPLPRVQSQAQPAAAPRPAPSAAAGDDDENPESWDGSERRRGPALRYSLNEFPLLPSGPSLWADVPTSVVHLDVLIGTLQNVMVVFEAPAVRAVGVVCDGERYDAIYIDSDGVKTGRVAWELMITAAEGTVSAYEIESEVARTLPVLWRNRIVHRDLDKTWINREDFLMAQRGDDEDRAVIVATPDAIGIALFQQGRAVACYSTDSRLPHYDLGEIQSLITEEGEGHVTVLERIGDDIGEAYIGRTLDESPLDEAEDVAAVAEAFSFQPIDATFARVESGADPEPVVASADAAETDPETTAPDADAEPEPVDIVASETTADEPGADPADASAAEIESATVAKAEDDEPTTAQPTALEPEDWGATSTLDVASDAAVELTAGAAAADPDDIFGTEVAPRGDPNDIFGIGTAAQGGDDLDNVTFAEHAPNDPPAVSDEPLEFSVVEAESEAEVGDGAPLTWDIPDTSADDGSAEPAAANADATAASDESEPAAAANADRVAEKPAAAPAPPPPAMTFAPSTDGGFGLADFASLLAGPAPGAPPVAPPTQSFTPMVRDDMLGAPTTAETSHHDTAALAAESEPPPPPPDFDEVIAELLHIGERFLGDGFGAASAVIADAPRTPAGLRIAISTIRKTEFAGQTPDEVTAMARAMTLYVADRVSAM